MAANLLPFRPAAVRAAGTSYHRKPDMTRRKNPSSNWWTPIFGLSADPDYIESESKADQSAKGESKSDMNIVSKTARSRIYRGGFTEEKARQLRMMTTEAESFHDAMYHSAIASRLASDFPNRSDL